MAEGGSDSIMGIGAVQICLATKWSRGGTEIHVFLKSASIQPFPCMGFRWIPIFPFPKDGERRSSKGETPNRREFAVRIMRGPSTLFLRRLGG